jgi:hypothetical protein
LFLRAKWTLDRAFLEQNSMLPKGKVVKKYILWRNFCVIIQQFFKGTTKSRCRSDKIALQPANNNLRCSGLFQTFGEKLLIFRCTFERQLRSDSHKCDQDRNCGRGGLNSRFALGGAKCFVSSFGTKPTQIFTNSRC